MEHTMDDITPRHAEPAKHPSRCVFEGCVRRRRHPARTCCAHGNLVERVRAVVYPGGYDTSKFTRKR